MSRKGLTEGGRPLPVHMSSLAKDVSENLSVKSTKIHQSQSRKSISHIDGHAENMLLRDLRTFGFLFESLAIRDLQIYAESLDAKLFHYQDYEGREIDAVIQFDDGTWSAFEVKLNPGDVDNAATNLKKVAAIFKHNPPTSLSVVVGKSGIAYRREDGVYVLPITSLCP